MAENRSNPDPVEGAPDVVDRELVRQDGQPSGKSDQRRTPTPDETTAGDRVPRNRDEVINSTNGLP